MIILGIDPGTAIVGYGVIEGDRNEKPKVLDFGCIITTKTSSTGKRLEIIYSQVQDLIKKFQPDIMSIENIFFFKNLKTVLPVSQAKGVILLAAQKNNIPVYEFTPLQMKMTIVGYGRADKKQIQEMTNRLLDLTSFNLRENNRKKDDAFDALGIALCAFLQPVNR